MLSYFFLKRLLSFPHFQLLTSLWPSTLSSPSIYLTFPSSPRTTSTKRGFPSKKIPTKKKKINSDIGKRESVAGDHVNK